MFLKNRFTLAKIFGISIRIDYSWLIIFFLITQSFAGQYFTGKPKFDLGTSIILGIVTSLLVFVCVLIHELSHSVVANRYGAKIKRITLFIFGGAAELSREPSRPGIEFKMAIAGPFSSLVLGFLMWGLIILSSNNHWPRQIQVIAASLRYFNFAVAIFNLLPGFPLDGGRIFRSILWWRGRDMVGATEIAASLGKTFGFGLILIGVVIFIGGDIISGLWLSFIGLFLNSAAGTSEEQSKLNILLSKVKVEKLMSKQVQTVDDDITVSEFIENYLLKKKLSGYPILKDGNVIGAVYFDAINKSVHVKRTDNIKILSTKLDKKQLISPQNTVLQALKTMGQYRLPSLPVLQGDKLVGIISQTDITYFLTAKSLIFD